MSAVLAVTAPIYLLVALGYAVVRLGGLDAAQIRALGRFTILVCVPALLFRAVTSQPLGRVLQADYLVVYTAASLLVMGLVYAVARRGLGRRPTLAALEALGACGSNSAFVGYPILLGLMGPAAGTALALNMLLENLFVIPLVLMLADAGAGSGRPRELLWQTLAAQARNPLMLGILAGLVVAVPGVPVPAPVERAIGLLAAATPPVALFVIGGTLVGLKLDGIRADLALVTGGKLLLHPALVALLMLAVPIADPELRVAAVLMAAMPMISIYPVLAQRHGEEKLCAAALLAATVGSFFTVSALIAVLR